MSVLLSCNRTEDSPQFKYTPLSTAIIEIEILKSTNDTTFIQAQASTNIPSGSSESNPIEIIESGIYYLSIEIDRPLSSRVTIGKETFNIFITPNDTTKIKISEAGKIDLQFSGSNQDMNKYYLHKKNNVGYFDIRNPLNANLTSKSTYNKLKQSIDSVVNVELSFLNHYKKTNDLPNWFIDFEKADITYSGASFKTVIPNYNRLFKTFIDDLPPNYFDYLNKIELNNESAIYSSNYLRFLDNYFIRRIPEEIDELSGFNRIRKIKSYTLKQSKVELAEKPKEVYHKYSFSALIKYYKDSLEIDSLAKEFEISDYKSLIKISGTISKNGMELLNLSSGDTIPEFYVTDTMDSLLTIREFQDKIAYVNFWATWCAPCIKNFPELNKMISEFSKTKNIVFLNICLDSDKEKWLSVTSQHQLKGINLLAEGNWSAKLKSYFNIKGIPHYTILGENNILIENFAEKAPAVKSRIQEISEINNTKK